MKETLLMFFIYLKEEKISLEEVTPIGSEPSEPSKERRTLISI